MPAGYRGTRTLEAPGALRNHSKKPYDRPKIKSEDVDVKGYSARRASLRSAYKVVEEVKQEKREGKAEVKHEGRVLQKFEAKDEVEELWTDEDDRSEYVDADAGRKKGAPPAPTSSRPEHCKGCDRYFSSHLQRHIKYHCRGDKKSEPVVNDTYDCPYSEECGKTIGYSRMDALLRHVREQHPERMDEFGPHRRAEMSKAREKSKRRRVPKQPPLDLKTEDFQLPMLRDIKPENSDLLFPDTKPSNLDLLCPDPSSFSSVQVDYAEEWPVDRSLRLSPDLDGDNNPYALEYVNGSLETSLLFAPASSSFPYYDLTQSYSQATYGSTMLPVDLQSSLTMPPTTHQQDFDYFPLLSTTTPMTTHDTTSFSDFLSTNGQDIFAGPPLS